MSTWSVLLLALLPSVQPSSEPIGPRPAGQAVEPARVDGQVIVRFREPTTPLAAAQLLDPARFVVAEELCPQLDMHLVLVADDASVEQAIADLEALPQVLYAVPDVVVTERTTVPNDPSFGTQWNMHNTGQSGGVVDADIDAPEAWDLGVGSKQFVVAIVDGGGQHNHTDLLANRWENSAEVGGTSGVDDDGNGYVDDLYGWNAFNNNGSIPSSSHATHCAGIAGARGNNGSGVAGVNWEVGIMYVAGSSGSTSTVIKAYTYVLTQRDLWLQTGGAKGANVVSANSSFGIDFANCASPTYKPWNDMYDLMGASGILNAGATINANVNVDVAGDVPTGCSSPWLIAVTNTTRTDAKASAGYGKVMIDLGAPGTTILSTVPTNGYGTMTGTSMATPHVTGAVAFLHSVASPAFQTYFATNPAQAALELKTLMLQHVDAIPSLNNITVSNGRLNLHQAALAISSWGCSKPVATYCTAKLNSQGCLPSIGASGSPSMSAGSGFVVSAAQLLPGMNGLFFYSKSGQDSVPFQGGTLCVAAPITRTGVSNSGGAAACSGQLSLDFNAYAASGVDPQLGSGTNVFGQFWSRDTSDPFGSSLTDAVEFQMCP